MKRLNLINSIPLKMQNYCVLLYNLSPQMLFSSQMLNYARYKLSTLSLKMMAAIPPSYIVLIVNRRCQLTCNFCSQGRTLNSKEWRMDELSLEQCKRILKNSYAKNALVFQLSGGEPLLNNEIVDIITFLKKNHRIVSMVSNGLLLKRENINAIVRAGLDMLNVSVYRESVDKLANILPSVTKAVFTKLSLVITPSILDDLPFIESVAMLAAKAKVRGLSFIPVHPTGKAYGKSDFLFFNDDQRYLMLQPYLKRKFPSTAFSFSAAPSPAHRNGLDFSNKGGGIVKTCRMPWYFSIIDARGRRGICCHDTECNHGNIFEQPLETIMNASSIVEIR